MAARTYRSTVSSKGQVTIPGPLRQRLGLERGAVLEFREEDGRIVVSKAWRDDPVSAVFGVIQDPLDVDAWIEELRGPVD